MSDLFPIIEVPEDAIQETESLGTKFKFWFRKDKLDYLYKQARLIEVPEDATQETESLGTKFKCGKLCS